MSDLIVFLRARLDDLERKNDTKLEPESWCDRASGLHMESAYVLADIMSKRKIITEHETWHSCGPAECNATNPCPTLLLLALPFADHPDYNPKWGDTW